MLVVKHLPFHNHIVFIGSKLAPAVVFQLVFKSLSVHQDVCVLTQGPRIGIDCSYTVWLHRVIACNPRVRVECGGNKQSLTLIYKGQGVGNSAPDGFGINKLCLTQLIPYPTAQLRVLKVLAEVFAYDVHRTSALIWLNERGNFINDWLLVVMERSQIMLAVVDMDGKRNCSRHSWSCEIFL